MHQQGYITYWKSWVEAFKWQMGLPHVTLNSTHSSTVQVITKCQPTNKSIVRDRNSTNFTLHFRLVGIGMCASLTGTPLLAVVRRSSSGHLDQHSCKLNIKNIIKWQIPTWQWDWIRWESTLLTHVSSFHRQEFVLPAMDQLEDLHSYVDCIVSLKTASWRRVVQRYHIPLPWTKS